MGYLALVFHRIASSSHSFIQPLLSRVSSAPPPRLIQDALYRSVVQLLQKDPAHHVVEVAPSSLSDQAGRGVFVRNSIGAAVKQHQALCLYPGVWIPPWRGPAMQDVDQVLGGYYRMDHTHDDNPYVLNLFQGGPVDGEGVMDGHEQQHPHQDVPYTYTHTHAHTRNFLADYHNARRLNPSSVGHLVNHAGTKQNINCFIVSFVWKDLFNYILTRTDIPPHHHLLLDPHNRYQIPNIPIHDKPWYMDLRTNHIVYHPPPPQSEAHAIQRGMAGAAFFAATHLQPGQELFFDYQLKGPPFPSWANHWYTKIS